MADNYLKLVLGQWRSGGKWTLTQSDMVTHLYWSSYSDKNSEFYVNYAGPESSDPGNYAGDMRRSSELLISCRHLSADRKAPGRAQTRESRGECSPAPAASIHRIVSIAADDLKEKFE